MLYHRDSLKAATMAVATDATRPALLGVRLEGSTLTATDGHVLISIDRPQISVEEFPAVEGFVPIDRAVTVPANALLEACKATAKNGSLLVLQHVAIGKSSGDKIRLVATDLDRTHNAELRELGPYPNWKQVLPTAKPTFQGALTVAVVLKLFKALKAAGLETVNVDLTTPLAAWKITGETPVQKVTAVLMPCRRGEE